METLQQSLGSEYSCVLVCNEWPVGPRADSEFVFWLDDDECKAAKVRDLTLIEMSAWDKGFLLAERMDPDFAWFAEDDVLVVDPDVFRTVDAAHPGVDLLISPDFVVERSVRRDWDWSRLLQTAPSPNLPLPWFGTACCAQVLRASRGMMRAARSHLDRELPKSNMIEYMWQTVAHHARLSVAHPEQMAGLDCHKISLRQIWPSRGEHFYHSVKGGWQQDKLRRLLRPRRKAL